MVGCIILRLWSYQNFKISGFFFFRKRSQDLEKKKYHLQWKIRIFEDSRRWVGPNGRIHNLETWIQERSETKLFWFSFHLLVSHIRVMSSGIQNYTNSFSITGRYLKKLILIFIFIIISFISFFFHRISTNFFVIFF